jgi:hypothetical protein
MLAVVLVELAASLVVAIVGALFSWHYPRSLWLSSDSLSREIAWTKVRLGRTFLLGCASTVLSVFAMSILSDGNLKFMFGPAVKLISTMTVLAFGLFGCHLAHLIRLSAANKD